MSSLCVPTPPDHWNPRAFLLDEEDIVDTMCVARMLQTDKRMLVGYTEDDIECVTADVTWAILKMLHKEES
jgi:hypothetical protein